MARSGIDNQKVTFAYVTAYTIHPLDWIGLIGQQSTKLLQMEAQSLNSRMGIVGSLVFTTTGFS
jgi:hypothetical protein